MNCDDEEDCIVGSGSGDGPIQPSSTGTLVIYNDTIFIFKTNYERLFLVTNKSRTL